METSPGEAADEGSNPSPPRQSEDVNRDLQSSSYVSSASSASQTRGTNEPATPVATAKTTINFRRNSADSDMIPPTPEHQFGVHPSHIYDSDASDGSIVFQFPSGTSKPNDGNNQQQPHATNHDRFPSMDSTGSFLLTGSHQSSPRSASGHKTPPSPPYMQQTPVQLLPYHERRKYMEKKQQQEQQQQQQQQHAQQFPPPGLMVPQFGQSPGMQQPYPPPPYTAFMGDPSQQMSPYGIPPQQSMHVPYMMGVPPPMQPPQQVHTSKQQPSTSSNKATRKEGSKGRAVASTDSRRKSLPPSGNARTMSGNAVVRSRTASTESVEAPPRPERISSRGAAPQQEPPPPPVNPPPPPAPQMTVQHIRGASSGSISSLGSAGGAGPDLDEFHSQNQEFLQRAEYERMRALQQQQAMMRDAVAAAGRQSLSPRLSSGGDSWEDSYETNVPQQLHPSMNPAYWQYPDPRGMPPPPDPYMYGYGGPGYYQQAGYPPGLYGGPPQGPMYGAPAARDYMGQPDRSTRTSIPAGADSSESALSASDATEDDSSTVEADETTSLLPPSGISTFEQRDRSSYTETGRRSSRRGKSSKQSRSGAGSQRQYGDRSARYGGSSRLLARQEEKTESWDNRTGPLIEEDDTRRKKSRKKQRKQSSRNRRGSGDSDDSDVGASSSSASYRASSSARRKKKHAKEKAKMLAKMNAESIMEDEARHMGEGGNWFQRTGQSITSEVSPIIEGFVKLLGILETIISNLPLTIGAVALSIVTLGIVWFKFAEENIQSCSPVHFHSSQCTFPEFPGCFYCDTKNPVYKVALNFHFTCSVIAGILGLSFVAKVILGARVVLDELSSPTTASPAGLFCLTTVCVFAGRGLIGQCLVTVAACLHLCLAIWFLYIALAYHILPEPSWFPNTVGIGLTAVKTWLYYPTFGHLLMAISLSLSLFFFPISLIRVFLNRKMSATVCWIQMSAPATALYALTIMAQPSFVEEHPDVTNFQRVHRMFYLPCMHFFFALAIIGAASSIQSFLVRWDDFRKKAFSPAHAAFCFPTLAHANAVQAYRAAVNSFADIPSHSPFKIALYTYWVVILVSGTLATLYITAKFMYHLPGWTMIDTADEEMPPEPCDTILTQKHMVAMGETLTQPFVSPAVLQANETGQLVMISRDTRDGHRRYRRTRHLTALGFEPIMSVLEMDREREVLLDFVAKHPPRRRTQTLSVPGIDFNYGFGDFGSGNTGVYGGHVRSSTVAGLSSDGSRPRSRTGPVGMFPPAY